ncbi:MAG: hypothetical protein M1825_001544 [Sarcosagium campestre]|nr:MAG: hypothetical protein M1825_001544 [Sarcosagium campestre]
MPPATSPSQSPPARQSASRRLSMEVDKDDVQQDLGPPNVTEDEWDAMQTILDAVYAYRDDEGHDPSKVFHRKVNKRVLPDYYDVIKDPVAMSTVKANINTKAYRAFSEFVRDFARIPHNAQLYNRPEAGAYQDAIVIRSVLETELKKLVDEKVISAEAAELPDLGEIPPPSPRDAQDDGEEEDEDEDDEEDDEADDSDDEGFRRRKRRGPRASGAASKRESGDGTKGNEAEARRKRGRPPRVDTPMEARIKAVMKGLRKIKDADGAQKISSFEKLPDKAQMPEYFSEIKSPMAIDLIKRKSKRKKYTSVDHFMKDVDLMFENAKLYNVEDSQIYKDAEELQAEAHTLAEQEKNRPDTDFVMEDGRLPLPSGILHNGELWKVGDWVHIQNPNDASKPIIAQLYRSWQDSDGQKWINACWYYRPEQTVHRAEKHFFEHEVVKTGQYRDHHVEEIVDRCFVMFVTRFSKGRPRGLPPDKAVYVCESRYNEEKHKLNKIKTWASCLPDEVREKDYEMDLFSTPRRMKKVPSPIRDRLSPHAKETDDPPKPVWGASNAPPIVGAVHIRPREPNESPPPEPTPSPPPRPAQLHQPSRQISDKSSTLPAADDSFRKDSQGDITMGGTDGLLLTTPTTTTPVAATAGVIRPQPAASPAISLSRPFQSTTRTSSSPTRSFHQTFSPQASQQASSSTAANNNVNNNVASFQANKTSTQAFNYGNHTTPAIPPRLSTTATTAPNGGVGASPASTTPTTTTNGVNNGINPPSRPAADVYRLSEQMNQSIPEEVRKQFHCDDQGYVLFFTTPPQDHHQHSTGPDDLIVDANANANSLNIITNGSGNTKLAHSVRYLAEKARQRLLDKDGHQHQQQNSSSSSSRGEVKVETPNELFHQQPPKRRRTALKTANHDKNDNSGGPSHHATPLPILDKSALADLEGVLAVTTRHINEGTVALLNRDFGDDDDGDGGGDGIGVVGDETEAAKIMVRAVTAAAAAAAVAASATPAAATTTNPTATDERPPPPAAAAAAAAANVSVPLKPSTPFLDDYDPRY